MLRNQIRHKDRRRTAGRHAVAPSAILAFLCVVSIGRSYGQTDTIETNVPALKAVFANDFTIGCLLSYPHVGFPDDPPVPGQSPVVAPHGGDLIRFHMNSMSPGNNMKPQYTVDISSSAAAYASASPGAARDSVNVHPVVRFNGNLIAQLNWAKRQGFTFRGHTLVWHSQTPGTAFFRSGYTDGGTRLSKAQMTERMRNYIRGIIRLLHENWPGLVSAMDVVNEAVNDDGTDRTGSEWYTTFGDNSYILKAFELTRQATAEYSETQMKLYYNDYNTSNPAKADGIVRTCGPIFRAGYLDGIGIQEHDALNSPTAAQWIASYTKFDTICTEMSVTELDVNPGGSPTPAVLATQANQYGMLFKCFVERSFRAGRGKIVNVSKDGLNDQYAFVANASLWDMYNKCKPAFFAVVNVGTYYNALDSLIIYAGALQEGNFTPESWVTFSASLALAEAARDQNYSSTVSADTALSVAFVSLEAAINELVIVSVADEVGHLEAYTLSQNYPNPFNPTTQIRYSVPQTSLISLKVYTLLGEEVATLFIGNREAGQYEATFNGAEVPSGIYLVRMSAGSFSETRKMILLK